MKTGCTVYTRHVHATRGLDLSFCQNIDSTYNKSVIPQYVSVYNVCLGTLYVACPIVHVIPTCTFKYVCPFRHQQSSDKPDACTFSRSVQNCKTVQTLNYSMIDNDGT